MENEQDQQENGGNFQKENTELAKSIGERGVLSTAVALLGEAWFRLGRLDDAESAAEQSRTTAADDDLRVVSGRIDFLGVNYYRRNVVGAGVGRARSTPPTPPVAESSST